MTLPNPARAAPARRAPARGMRWVRSYPAWSPPLLAGAVVLVSLSAQGPDMSLVIILALVYVWLIAALLVIHLQLIVSETGRLQISLRQMLVGVACLCCVLSVMRTHWPLKVRFEFSRGAVESLADRVERGEEVALPARAGLLLVRDVEVNRAGQACLWTDPHVGGSTGFVRCRPRDGGPRLNLAASVPLGAHWYFVSED